MAIVSAGVGYSVNSGEVGSRRDRGALHGQRHGDALIGLARILAGVVQVEQRIFQGIDP